MTDISSSDNTAQAATAGAKNALQKASHWSAAQWWGMIKTSFAAWVDDYAPSMGAALAYYTVFSLAPLLVIVISVAGLIFGPDAVRGAISTEFTGLMGADAAKGIQDLLSSVSKPSTGIIGSVLGVVVLLIGATTVFGELQDALDRIWRAPARVRSSGLLTLLRTRILSFGMILGIAFLLMVSLVTGAAIAALGKWWDGWFAGWEVLAQIINASVGFFMTTAVFALIYKLMPRVKVGWGDVWVGAAVTAMLFTLGRLLISLYIGKTGIASGFGAAGSVAVIFVWVYYSAQVFLVGAEFTWVYAKCMGSQQHLAKPTAQELLSAADIPQLSAELAHQTGNQTSLYATGGSVTADVNDAPPVAPVTMASNLLPLALAGFASLVALTLLVRGSRSLLSEVRNATTGGRVAQKRSGARGYR
jgi:membrane protein